MGKPWENDGKMVMYPLVMTDAQFVLKHRLKPWPTRTDVSFPRHKIVIVHSSVKIPDGIGEILMNLTELSLCFTAEGQVMKAAM